MPAQEKAPDHSDAKIEILRDSIIAHRKGVCYDGNIMNEQAFCFIICASDELLRDECMTYLQALDVPDGFSVKVMTVFPEDSIGKAYQTASRSTDAKYRIFLQQETLILHRSFLSELLQIFADPTIGMIGIIGTDQLSGDGFIENSPRIGSFFGAAEMIQKKELTDFTLLCEGIRDVIAADGMLLATQIDLPWPMDTLPDDDPYDVAYSLLLRKNGYRVVVPGQGPTGWCRFSCFHTNKPGNAASRKDLLKKYPSYVPAYSRETRIIYPHANPIRGNDILHAMELLGITPLSIEMNCDVSSIFPEDINRLSRLIRELHADAVFTHDFSPFAAIASAENGIPYISWIWDSPQECLYHESIRLSTNYIFDFDRIQAADTVARHAPYVRHMPLAADVHQIEQLEITKADEALYACDISFVGSVYNEEANWCYTDRNLPEQTLAELDSLIANADGIWDGKDHIADILSDTAISDIAAVMTEFPSVRKLMGEREYIEKFKLSRYISHLERLSVFGHLSGRDLRLYTSERDRAFGLDLPHVQIHGSLDSNTEAPKAYYLSRINLNLTLPSIRSGIPLRVFQILASGGFLLTNYQPELEEYFEIGKELEVFHSYEELKMKSDYYLQHERDRLQIALNGNIRVRECYSCKEQVRKILSCVSFDLKNKGRNGLL